MVEIDLISVWGRNLTWLQCRDRNWLDFCVDHRSWIVLVYGSKLTFFFVSAQRNRLDTRVGVEIYLVSVMGSKLAWDLCAGSILTYFYCAGRNAWLQGMDRRWHDYRMPTGNPRVILWAWKLTWFLRGWSKLSCFQCGRRNLIWFECGDEIVLVVVWGVEIDLILLLGSEWTWCLFDGRQWLAFSVWKEMSSVFVPGYQNRLDIWVGILREGFKLTWFWRGYRSWLVFVRGSKSASFCVLVEFTSF